MWGVGGWGFSPALFQNLEKKYPKNALIAVIYGLNFYSANFKSFHKKRPGIIEGTFLSLVVAR